MLRIEVPSGQGRVETSVVGWGRNERDQLGLNHAAEIRSVLKLLAYEALS